MDVNKIIINKTLVDFRNTLDKDFEFIKNNNNNFIYDSSNDIINHVHNLNNQYNMFFYNSNFSGQYNTYCNNPDIDFDNNSKNNTDFIDNIDITYQNTRNKHFEHVINKKTIVKEKIFIEDSIESINDLLNIIEKNPLDENFEYNIDMVNLHAIKSPLNKLNNMIGMKSLKNDILDQIIYYTQKFNTNSSDFMHTVIYGPPGTGKTEIAKYIGEIFSKLGVLKNNKFKKVTRSDLVAGYLGQTAIKTREVVEDCLGGVLFIDEAYALGNSEKRDSFSKECIDTLCELLSDHKDNLMVIIAGYENELKECFFEYNKGLLSRFAWKYNTDKYNGEQLKQIFIKKVEEINWHLDDSIDNEWFNKNVDAFTYYGRDIETLLAKTKITHSRRIFGKDQKLKTFINIEDLEKGFEKFISMNESDKDKNKDTLIPHMYM